jgi:P4 family phage/plasmid primase-like protien
MITLEPPSLTISPDIRDKNGKFKAMIFVHDLLNQTPRLHFKTLLNEKGGDVIWMYNWERGIYQPTGIGFVEQAVQHHVGEDVKREHLSEVIKQLQVSSYIMEDEFREDPASLVLKNGEFDLVTRTMHPYDPYHNHLNAMPIKFDPNADCPHIKKFIEEVLPGDLVTVQEWFGYHLWKTYRIQKLFVFHGVGANGKSTLINLLTRWLGEDNVSHVGLFDLTANRFAKVELYGKLANVAPDISTDEIKRTGIIKELTGEDKIRAEKKNQNAFYFYNTAKITFSCNQLPTTPDESEAFFRRFMVLDFKQIFSEDKADPDLINKLTTEEELSGLFNWALEGLYRLMANGRFTEGRNAADMKKLYMEMADPINAFVHNCIEEASDEYVEKEKILVCFNDFCRMKGYVAPSEREFYTKFRTKIFVKEVQKTLDGRRLRVWEGLFLKCCTGCTGCTAFTKSNQEKVTNIESESPVHVVHGVQEVLLSERQKVVANALSGHQNSTVSDLASGIGLSEEDCLELLNSLMRDHVAFVTPGGRWRWSG